MRWLVARGSDEILRQWPLCVIHRFTGRLSEDLGVNTACAQLLQIMMKGEEAVPSGRHGSLFNDGVLTAGHKALGMSITSVRIRLNGHNVTVLMIMGVKHYHIVYWFYSQ